MREPERRITRILNGQSLVAARLRWSLSDQILMTYTVTCDCGRSVVVRTGDAGSRKPCTCGTLVTIPSLSVLRESLEPGSSKEEPSQPSANPTVIFGIALAVVLVVGIVSTPLLVPLGVLMVMAGRLWFALQILGEMSLPNAMMVFFIPFMPTVFLFKRFDIAWKPFVFGIAGFIVVMIGAASAVQ